MKFKLVSNNNHILNARYFSGLIIGCLQGVSKVELLSPRYSPCGIEYWTQHPMVLTSVIAYPNLHSSHDLLGS